MKQLTEFFKTVILGGLFVLLPLLLLYLLLDEMLELVVALATPIADLFPADTFEELSAPVVVAVVLILLASFLLWRGRLFETRWLLKIFVVAVLAAVAANQLGWVAAEVGRQPWIVYGVMKTSDAVSPIATSQVATTLVGFILIYGLLGAVGFFLMFKNARKGPKPV